MALECPITDYRFSVYLTIKWGLSCDGVFSVWSLLLYYWLHHQGQNNSFKIFFKGNYVKILNLKRIKWKSPFKYKIRGVKQVEAGQKNEMYLCFISANKKNVRKNVEFVWGSKISPEVAEAGHPMFKSSGGSWSLRLDSHNERVSLWRFTLRHCLYLNTSIRCLKRERIMQNWNS